MQQAGRCGREETRGRAQGERSGPELGQTPSDARAFAKGLRKDYRHAHVPKNVNLQEEFGKHIDSDVTLTTLMIRNIPNFLTQRQLINMLGGRGLAGCFDFLYIPLDKGTMANVGYAFVNFVTPQWAVKCSEVLQNFRFKGHRKVGCGSPGRLPASQYGAALATLWGGRSGPRTQALLGLRSGCARALLVACDVASRIGATTQSEQS